MALTKGTPEYEAFLQQWRRDQARKPPAPLLDGAWQTTLLTFRDAAGEVSASPFFDNTPRQKTIERNNAFLKSFAEGCRDLVKHLEDRKCFVESLSFLETRIDEENGHPYPRIEGTLRFLGWEEPFEVRCRLKEEKTELYITPPAPFLGMGWMRIDGLKAETFYTGQAFTVNEPKDPKRWLSKEGFSVPAFLQAIYAFAKKLPTPEALSDFSGFTITRQTAQVEAPPQAHDTTEAKTPTSPTTPLTKARKKIISAASRRARCTEKRNSLRSYES